MRVTGDRLVGENHRLLDHRGGIGLVAQVDAHDHATLVKDGLGLNRLEVNRATGQSQREQSLGKRIEARELGGIRVITFPVEDILHLIVVETSLAADDARVYLVASDIRRCIEIHVTGHGQAIFAGLSEQTSLLSFSGSIGNTRSTR